MQLHTFVHWALEKKRGDADFSNKILFSDEEYFLLDGHVSNQNYRTWDDDRDARYGVHFEVME